MQRDIKIILGSLGGLVILGLGLIVAFFLFAEWQMRQNLAKMHINDPVIVAQIADSMADYDLPPYYNVQFVSNLKTAKALYIFVGDDIPNYDRYPIITLVQFPPERYPNAVAARETLRSQSDSKIENEAGTGEVTHEKTTTIREQVVGLTYYKWIDNKGEEHRAIISDIFAGKEGFLQLKIEGPATGWQEEEIDAFIRSLH